MTRQAGVKSLRVSGSDEVDCVFNATDHLVKFGHGDPVGKGLTGAEAYIKGWLDIWFDLGRDIGFARCTSNASWEAPKPDLKKYFRAHKIQKALASNRNRRIDGSKFVGGKSNAASCRENQFVLVGNIENVKTVQQFIPTFIRLERLYRVDDLFSGELYLSIRNGSVQSYSRLSERKLDNVGAGGKRPDDRKDHYVEGGFQVVNCIPDDQPKGFRDGLIGFDSMGSLASVFIMADDQFKWAFGQKSINLPVKIIDVMLGPLNF